MTTLQFRQTTAPPAYDARVYAETTRAVRGIDLQLRVIGSSHAVAAPAIDYYEVASCTPSTDGVEVPLDPTAPDERMTHTDGDLRCETLVRCERLASFPAERTFDLHHRFADRAVTALAVLDRGVETYHTYPEHDLTVYSHTRFVSIPESIG